MTVYCHQFQQMLKWNKHFIALRSTVSGEESNTMVSSSSCKGLFLDILTAGLHGVAPTTLPTPGVCKSTEDVLGISSAALAPMACDTTEDVLWGISTALALCVCDATGGVFSTVPVTVGCDNVSDILERWAVSFKGGATSSSARGMYLREKMKNS